MRNQPKKKNTKKIVAPPRRRKRAQAGPTSCQRFLTLLPLTILCHQSSSAAAAWLPENPTLIEIPQNLLAGVKTRITSSTALAPKRYTPRHPADYLSQMLQPAERDGKIREKQRYQQPGGKGSVHMCDGQPIAILRTEACSRRSTTPAGSRIPGRDTLTIIGRTLYRPDILAVLWDPLQPTVRHYAGHPNAAWATSTETK